MARVSRRKEHDWLAVNATFADGTKANVTWSRNGETVTVQPDRDGLAETLSLIVKQNLAHIRAKTPGYPITNLGETSDAMAVAAEASATPQDYLALLKAALRVSGARPAPAANGPAQSIVSIRKSRGWVVYVHFPSGEKIELKVNTSSVGMRMSPEIPSISAAIMRMALGLKQTGAMSDEAVANLMGDAARNVEDSGKWLEAAREAVAPPGRAPGR